MFFQIRSALSLYAVTCVISHVKATCASYGVDFQNGGTYFLDSTDSNPFTSVTQFSGCSGTANVILEGPDEVSYLCSDIATSPDYTNEMSTCPLNNNDLYNGTWSIVILDNNGDEDSFSAMRTFQLVVAPQQTVTYIPTVIITTEVYPSTVTTSTFTDVESTTLVPVTITTVKTARATRTVTPARVTTTKTVTLSPPRVTVSQRFSNSIITLTKTAACTIPTKGYHPDPVPGGAQLKLAQQILAANGIVTATTSSSPITTTSTKIASSEEKKNRLSKNGKSHPARDSIISRRGLLNRHPAIARALEKRSPDIATLTVTDTNTADWITTTSTSYDTTTTLTALTTISTTLTITPAAVTAYTGFTVATVTLPTPTRTVTDHTRLTITTTKTKINKITITTTITPASVYTSCAAKGGHL